MFHNQGPSGEKMEALSSRLEYTLQIFTGFLPIEESPLLDGGVQAGCSRLV